MADDDLSISPSVAVTQEEFNETVRELVDDFEQPYETDENDKLKVNTRRIILPAKRNVKNNFSQVLVLSSMKKNGFGKSSLGWHLTSGAAGTKFNFERNFFFNGTLEDIKEQTNHLPPGDMLFMDELVRVWYNRQAMSRGNIDINKWMAADQRKTRVILGGAIPDFWNLDSYAREGKIDIYIEALARGIGVVFKSDVFPKTDPWHADVFDQLTRLRVRRKKIANTLTDKLEILEKHPCFDGLVFWNRMPDSVESEYLSVLKKKIATVEEQQTEDEVTKFKREFLMEHETEKTRAWQAVINFVRILGIRGIPLSRALRDAGLSQTEYSKYVKYFEGKHKEEIASTISKDVQGLLSDNRMERKPTSLEPTDKEIVQMPAAPKSYAERFAALTGDRKDKEKEEDNEELEEEMIEEE